MKKPEEIEIIRRTINQITQHPKTHNQRSWHSDCGTKHCFAGHCQIVMGRAVSNAKAMTDAKEGMGLTDDEANYLFSPSRTLTELFEAAKVLISGEEIFNRDGYDRYGCDSYGYNRYGYNRDGYNRDGYNRDGYNRDGYNRYGYNRDGCDRYGYNRYGYDSYGYNRDGYDSDGYNRDGYDRDGCDRDGKKLPLL